MVRTRAYFRLRPLFDELRCLKADDPRRRQVREQLITGHLPVAKHIAMRFCGRGTSREDLEQVATIGLIHAVDRFDPAKGSDFLSFAVPTVTGEVKRYFRDSTWTVHVPRSLKELTLAINGAVDVLVQRLGRSPRPSEIAEYLHIDRDKVCEGLQAAQSSHQARLDERLRSAEGHLTLGETIGTDDESLNGVETLASLQPAVRELSVREQRILVLRFCRNMTQSEIAKEIGISQMHVSRLLARSLKRLRKRLG